jgi:hypothetical protein
MRDFNLTILQIFWDNVVDDSEKFIKKQFDERMATNKKIHSSDKTCKVLIVTTEW